MPPRPLPPRRSALHPSPPRLSLPCPLPLSPPLWLSRESANNAPRRCAPTRPSPLRRAWMNRRLQKRRRGRRSSLLTCARPRCRRRCRDHSAASRSCAHRLSGWATRCSPTPPLPHASTAR
eukprot:3308796-Prymnesium_polylepis.1